MTQEEMDKLKERINQGTALKARVDCFTEALAHFDGGSIAKIIVPMKGEGLQVEMFYSKESDQTRVQRVCWSEKEKLCEELRQEYRAVLVRFLTNAAEAYAKL